MEKIKISNNDQNVSIKVTIEYNGPSKYVYHATPEKFFSYRSDQVPHIEYPHPYNIGEGSSLTNPQLIENNWDIELQNPTNVELEYKVKIEWFQGSMETPIYTWPQKEDDRKGKVAANSDGPDLSANCRYKY